ncbi:MAG: acylphosphatase [Candidatus Portnoybacteria bacterium]|nr:acylphosphatase [Candidatus Portnoybacteria bacterium]
MSKKQVILKIYGRVQGIFFRDSTRRKARKLGLTGWVRNESDRTVKVVAEGEKKKLEELIKWCYNGPIIARVEKIDVEWQEAAGQFEGFEIKY